MGFSTLKVTLINCQQNVLLFLTFNSQFHHIFCIIPDSAYILNLSQISAPFPITANQLYDYRLSHLGSDVEFSNVLHQQFPNSFELVMVILIMVIMLVMLVILVMLVMLVMVVMMVMVVIVVMVVRSPDSGHYRIEQDGTGQKFHLHLTSQVNL